MLAIPSIAELTTARQSAYEDAARSYGLSADEASQLFSQYEAQLQAALTRFQRAQQQAVAALSARLEQAAAEKRAREA